MATYKVLQDVEAEDKLVGPLTLRQFIYAAITVIFFYLSFFAYTKNVAFLMAIFIPPALFTAFLAIPWRGDQPTEVWAVAKLRFLLKPRKRIWDQSGIKKLVTITVPKKIEEHRTNGLSQGEVRSRLYALASTIDSRGWAVKNSRINLTHDIDSAGSSDRLVEAAMLPQEVSNIEVTAYDDMLDSSANPIAQHFDSMMHASAATQKQQLIQSLSSQQAITTDTAMPAATPQASSAISQWFNSGQPAAGFTTPPTADPVIASATQPVAPPPYTPSPQAATPTPEEAALLEQSAAANSYMNIANDHLKRINTPEELAAVSQASAAVQQAAPVAPSPQLSQAAAAQKAQVTSDDQAAIMNLAQNDDLSVATIARQAKKKRDPGQEVVISLR